MRTADRPPHPVTSIQDIRLWLRTDIASWGLAAASELPSSQESVFAGLPTGRSQEGHSLLTIAGHEAKRCQHSYIGVDHLVLALVHNESSGLARRILESLGFTHAGLTQEFAKTNPPEAEPRAGAHVVTAAALLLERANLWAVHRSDPVAASEHVVLSLIDRWPTSPLTEYMKQRGLESEALALRAMSVADAAIWGEYQLGGAEHPRIGVSMRVELALRPDGVDHLDRRPWTSDVATDDHGRPIKRGAALVQYFVDRDGSVVRATDGRLVHLLVDERGRLVSQAGAPILVAVDPPT
ncbi:MAG: hypothetical protein DLM66_04575 [Candidatus Dormiibacter spiritus]|nr:MAG: hypothetical protein DLM66_04575 [Candidatus Dormibacteraeota bacterium]